MNNILRLVLLLVSIASYAVFAVEVEGNATTTLNFSYTIQKPYNVDVSERYSATNGIYDFWVYSWDKPFSETSDTEPRTEMRIKNDYRSGVHIYEGDLYVPSGTTGATVFQVFGGSVHATACQLRTSNGNLYVYGSNLIESSIYNRWVHLKVQHDVSQHTVKVWVAGTLKATVKDNGDPDNTTNGYYFKLGVYTSHDPSNKMESKHRNMVVSTA
jgi:hypothetical protein